MKWKKMEFWENCEVFCEVFFLEHDIIGRIFAPEFENSKQIIN